MTRKRIELERVGLRTPRERMWLAMRTLVEFSPSDIEDKAHPITRDAVHSYIDGLVAAGFIRQIQVEKRSALGQFQPARYVVVKATPHTPQLDKKGQPVQQSLGTLAMWRAMKVRKVFDAAQIAMDASQGDTTCTLYTAKHYLLRLHYAGYLRVEKAPNTHGGLTRFRLVKDTGPLPPAITRAKVVFDRNTGALMPVQTAQEVCDALES